MTQITRIKWIVAIIVMASLCALPIALGFWQLDRAQQKKALLQQQHAVADTTIIVDNLDALDKVGQFQTLQISGEYDNTHQFLLDNRFHDHQLGYDVLTPFYVDNKILLVNRGWIPRLEERRQLPTLPAIASQQTIVGTVYYPAERRFTLSDDEEFLGIWPQIIQNVDTVQLSQQLNQDIIPFTLRLNKDQADGFTRDWPIITMSVEKHIGYAVQWFIIAIVLIICFITVCIKSRSRTEV